MLGVLRTSEMDFFAVSCLREVKKVACCVLSNIAVGYGVGVMFAHQEYCENMVPWICWFNRYVPWLGVPVYRQHPAWWR